MMMAVGMTFEYLKIRLLVSHTSPKAKLGVANDFDLGDDYTDESECDCCCQ